MRLLTFSLLLATAVAQAADPIVVKLWPKGAPEKPGFKIEPETSVDKGDGIMRTSNVSDPTIAIYKAEKPNGTAVVVCPGGGYSILAIEHEGSKVCEWLNSIGVTGVLLKYRVPRRDNTNPSVEPMQDAQRAIGIVRHRASEWGIKPDRVGILGFSAGGNLCVMTSLHPNERTYPEDPALDMDARPNFMVPVYPAYIVTDDKNPTTLKSEMVVTKDAPTACFVHANDDKISAGGDALLYLEYKKLGLPAELHVFAKGGHGFGMKPGPNPANHWTDRVGEWMKSMGLLDEK
jgi:acetyl esterase/lipase